MRITRVECENFMRLEAVDVKFHSRVTEVAGNNGAGKSTLLWAIKTALMGKDAMPADPIRHGADQAFIRTHLEGDPDGGLLATVRLKTGEDGKVVYSLVLETPEGARFPTPATHLKKLLKDHLLDPLYFIQEMTEKEQYDALRSFVPNFDFAKNEQLRKGAAEKRTEIGRDALREQKAAEAIDITDEAPGERVDEAALTAALQSAGEHNADIERRKANRAAAVQKVAAHRAEAARCKAECDRLLAEIQRIRDIGVREEVAADELQAKIDSAEALPPPADAAAITLQLNEARRTNKAINDWEAQRARKQSHEREASRLSAEYDNLTAKIAEYDQAKKDAIQKATLPVDGLGFEDGYITLKGARFNNASQGEKMRTAFAVCAAKRPELPFCWIRDASLLDDTSLKLVDELSAEFDMDTVLEFVRPNSSNCIVIEDGRVKGAELPPSTINPPKAEATTDEFALSADAPADKPKGRASKQPPRKWTGPGAPKGDAA